MVALNLIQAVELEYYFKNLTSPFRFSNPAYVPSFPVSVDRPAADVFWGPLTTLHSALKTENQNACWSI